LFFEHSNRFILISLGSFWKQFLKTAGGPPAFIADQKYCVKPADISEKLEKAGGKSRPQPKKFVSKAA
jgi:hypothetical protein